MDNFDDEDYLDVFVQQAEYDQLLGGTEENSDVDESTFESTSIDEVESMVYYSDDLSRIVAEKSDRDDGIVSGGTQKSVYKRKTTSPTHGTLCGNKRLKNNENGSSALLDSLIQEKASDDSAREFPQPKNTFNRRKFLIIGADMPNIAIPFLRLQLQNKITNQGGTVCSGFKDEVWNRLSKAKVCDQHFVIAQTYSSMISYTKALVVGIPCIQHTWVLACSQQNQLLNYNSYLLATGWSRTKKVSISRMPKQNIFNNLYCIITGTKALTSVCRSWNTILTLGGATVLPEEYVYRSNLCEAVTHGTIPVAILIGEMSEKYKIDLKQHKFQLCNLSWIKEWTILGCRPRLTEDWLLIEDTMDYADDEINSVKTETLPMESFQQTSSATVKTESVKQENPIDESSRDDGNLNIDPLQRLGSSIFNNVQFVIVKTPKNFANCSPPNALKSRHPFSESELASEICAGGGSVLTESDLKKINWRDVMYKNTPPTIFLIAEWCNKTKIYLQALVTSLPCVSHEWIIESCQRRELLNYECFLLPAGESILSDKLCQWHGRVDIMKGHNISIKSSNEKSKNYKFWKNLLELSGGLIISTDCYFINALVFAAVVIDEYYPVEETRKLKARGIKVLTKDWFIESIVRGHPVGWQLHRDFSAQFASKTLKEL